MHDTPKRHFSLIDNLETVEIRFLVNNVWVREWRIATQNVYSKINNGLHNPDGVSGISMDDLPSLVEVSWVVTDNGVSRDYVHYFRTGQSPSRSPGVHDGR